MQGFELRTVQLRATTVSDSLIGLMLAHEDQRWISLRYYCAISRDDKVLASERQ